MKNKKTTLIDSLAKADNVAFTENSATSFASTLDANLDWFGKVGALRGQDAETIKLFQHALGEDPLKALKILFYGRDVRGGQGERKVFQLGIGFLAKNYPDYLDKNLKLIPEYGYWKDLFVLFGTKFEPKVLAMIKEQLGKDLESAHPSLLAKWMPSGNTSSKETRKLARKVREYLGLTPREYRKTLSHLREQLNVVERDLSSRQFGQVNYSHVPSKANLKYTKAFLRNDEIRYRGFLGAVTKGEAKMNAGALYPYQMVDPYLKSCWGGASRPSNDQALQALWDSLPNYLEGNEHKGLVMADVSGSMFSNHGGISPISVCVSLAMYMAERNTGPFQDAFLTFSSSPKLTKLQGSDLYTKISNLVKADWGMSTDVQAAFTMVLKTAVASAVPQSDMPDVIYIISDMQFNSCAKRSNLDGMKSQYANAGYKMPKLVFWNVRSGADVPITKYDENTALVSGCTPNIFEAVLNGNNPVDVMNKVIESDRYNPISV